MHNLLLDPSPNAKFVGYKRPTQRQRTLARKLPANKDLRLQHDLLDRAVGTHESNPGIYPAPLILPYDDLAWDPSYEPQTLQDCTNTVRKILTPQRRTIYVARPPTISPDLPQAATWSQPQPPPPSKPSRGKKSRRTQPTPPPTPTIPQPSFDDLLSHLRAFYHPFAVQPLPLPLTFTPWTTSTATHPTTTTDSSSIPPKYISLTTPTHSTRIRVRPPKDTLFPAQLNLNDILDVAISILPLDAYALLLVVDQDLYEDEEDDFCCGRAYGGSHVAVVSTARYHPALDEVQGVERGRAWPMAHDAEWVMGRCVEEGVVEEEVVRKKGKGRKRVMSEEEGGERTALSAAVGAFEALAEPKTEAELELLWFGRVCKTASHELGHCIGMDHCVYYACVMQGTAGLAEDARQPPYLCPVDMAKLITATGMWTTEHHEKLLAFCQRFADRDRLFAAFAAWLEFRKAAGG